MIKEKLPNSCNKDSLTHALFVYGHEETRKTQLTLSALSRKTECGWVARAVGVVDCQLSYCILWMLTVRLLTVNWPTALWKYISNGPQVQNPDSSMPPLHRPLSAFDFWQSKSYA